MTSTSNNDHYFGAILEDIQSKMDLLIGLVLEISEKLDDINVRMCRVEKVADENMSDVKEIAKKYSIQSNNYGNHTKLLETK